MILVKHYSTAVPNARKTLQSKVSISHLMQRVKDPKIREQLARYNVYGKLNFWDVGKTASEYISQGNLLAIICGVDVYAGEILAIINDRSGNLGDCLDWARQYGNPWTNVLLLNNLQQSQKCSDVNLTRDFPLLCQKLARAFYGVRTEKEKEFISLLGRNGLHSGGPVKSREPIPPAPINELSHLKAAIQHLRNDPKHAERGHESLVERFFENLGYRNHEEIKYRAGRVDILIRSDQKPLIVVEVKRYWNLTKHDEAVIQGYRYALENGARYVIVTNGDYYAVFDRIRGLSMQSNFVMEFTLTDLNPNEHGITESLKKDKLIAANQLKEVMTTFLSAYPVL
ncbi:MAG TPA: type I restriction enzyme HsdR N-terminal domain-containing protein [Thermodesulfobacteriota bacterium]|nr:type I restriction enzyme HsdR N-terminal domain-containing protein [Thermodesulfobacteriota bacterium]HQO78368.1 type I restriction enzyme HsdR N-terminal domain-containing protein [Thermodesulfobacteriota bacterium]